LIVEGAGSVARGDGGGYFNLIFGVLCSAALYRFVYEWWLRTKGPATS